MNLKIANSSIYNLKLSEIILDKEIQPRKYLNQDLVAEYAKSMKQRATFPPVIVYFDGNRYWLADGFHRVNAKKRIGESKILADVRSGSRREAKLFAVEINVNNGNQRTNADKHRAVERLLRDYQWSCWSNREIAKRCGVNEKTVRNVKKQIQADSTHTSSFQKLQQPSTNRLTQQNRKALSMSNSL